MNITDDPHYFVITAPVAPTVVVSDPDDGAYPIGMQLSTSAGVLKMNLSVSDLWQTNKYTFVSCSTPNIGCSSITVYGGVHEMNDLLAGLSLQVYRRFFTSADSVTIRVYKPASAGITSHDDGQAIDDGKYLPDVTVTVGIQVLNYTVNATTTSTSSTDDSLYAAAFFILIFIAPFTCCFCATYSCLLNVTEFTKNFVWFANLFPCTRWLKRCCTRFCWKGCTEDHYIHEDFMVAHEIKGKNGKPLLDKKGKKVIQKEMFHIDARIGTDGAPETEEIERGIRRRRL